MSKKPLLDDTSFLFLAAATMISAVFVCGLYLYSGSVLPSTQGASDSETRSLWIQWGLIVAMPVIPALWWLISRFTRSRN